MVRKRLTVALLLMAATCCHAAHHWEFVEVDVSIRPDGKATVTYQVAIDPQGQSLHGFYFQGFRDWGTRVVRRATGC